MCGIVVYYGDAENRLTRILTGMWAIIYRAPDSTGIGMLGNEPEPLKIRRELGSVEDLIDRILVEPVFDETQVRAAAAMETVHGDHGDFIAGRQAALLAFEGFSIPKTPSYPRWSALTNTRDICLLHPGTPGNPRIQETFPIDSPKALKKTITRLVSDFDLPPAMVEKLVQQGFEARADALAHDLPLDKADLVREFRQIFNCCAYDEAGDRPRRVHRSGGQKHPYARKYAWQILCRVVVVLPPDFTTDGVTVLFRHLESWMPASHNRDTADRIQQIFNSFWEVGNQMSPPRWQTLFAAERAANVYGIAAASVMACFQTEVYMKQDRDAPGYLPQGHVPGPTHPLLLRFMSQPVIGQGRWAIQSAISVRNAHPFMDRNQNRAVVLNGQFDSGVETRISEYLTRVAGCRLRTDNSTEFFSMLWGHYFDTACWENRRYSAIEEQHRLGLEDLSISSKSIDYTDFRDLTGKTSHELDEMAFIRAVEAMIPDGGQFAVSGISRISPDRLFLAAHKRPVYIVKRRETHDFMVVSDINAALGLFPQALIQSTARRLRRLMKAYSKTSMIVEPDFFNAGPAPRPGDSQAGDDWFRREKIALLAPFLVDVYALDGPRLFAAIRTTADGGGIVRELTIRDFSGKKRSDIRPEQTLLTPVSFQKDFGSTFYEAHLREIPGLLRDTLSRHVDPGTGLPEFKIRQRMMTRRFGGNLSSLNRIILVGTGFTFTLAEIVEKTMEPFFSGVNIVAVTPLETSDTFINPDRDLVVMMSWSGTTADMIDAAARMLKQNVLMVAFTEKPFSDLALAARKSAGVIPVCSGEEVTVAPLKSAVSMLMALDLFCIWLTTLLPVPGRSAAALAGEMRQIPGKVSALLGDASVEAFCRNTALEFQSTHLHYIVDAFHDIGSSKTGVLNLEVNTWISMGNALDYSELDEFMATPMAGDELILVNATSRKRMDEAVGFMAALKDAGRPFVACSAFSHEQADIQTLADRTVFLPDLPDYFQPFVDLVFMFLFGFYYGLAHGRLAGEMPRNMAKSVTAGRTRGGEKRTATDILDDLEETLAEMAPLPEPATKNKDLCWIQSANTPEMAGYYRALVRLGNILQKPDPFGALFGDKGAADFQHLSTLIFKHLAEDGIMILVPMDRQAEAACRNFIGVWEPFLDIPLQVEFPEKLGGVSTEDSLVVAVASERPAPGQLPAIYENAHEHLLWIGPGSYTGAFAPFASSCGACFLAAPVSAAPHENLYVALTLFFSRVMSHVFPERSKGLEDHFRLLSPLLFRILDSRDLLDRVLLSVAENRAYRKRLFVSGFRGNCTAWQTAAEGRAPKGLECEPFGVSAYHHLVLVDPRGPEKFVAMTPRDTMLDRYPESEIRTWEESCLGGATVDEFLTESALPIQADAVLPFLIDGQWYLPVLNPHYDAGQDCLVTIDATSGPRFDSALDELAAFGSRYARIVVITQAGFARDARLGNLKKYPLSHLILVPGLPGRDGLPVPVSDFLMPVAVNLVGTAMAFLEKAGAGI
ncbi:MAG: SIS domain-containing protein [Desulfobacter sp.]